MALGRVTAWPALAVGPFRRILVPLSGASAIATVECAVRVAIRDRACLTLLHVIEPPYYVGGFDLLFAAPGESEGAAEALLVHAAAQVPEGIPVKQLIRMGPVTDEILYRAATAEHDLVVFGSSSRRLGLGSPSVVREVRRRNRSIPRLSSLELGQRIAGHIRAALEVEDVRAVTAQLETAGATVLAPHAHSWNSLNRAAGGAGWTPTDTLHRPRSAEHQLLAAFERADARRHFAGTAEVNDDEHTSLPTAAAEADRFA
jgi:nucleotide-binding universal stress UspA family protein